MEGGVAFAVANPQRVIAQDSEITIMGDGSPETRTNYPKATRGRASGAYRGRPSQWERSARRTRQQWVAMSRLWRPSIGPDDLQCHRASRWRWASQAFESGAGPL